MALISCRGVSLAYDDTEVVSGLNFEVNEGDYLCIIGENGSGKTTLMKALLGLLRPSVGEIVTGDGLKQNEIGYLPQQSSIQRDFPASVREIVLSGTLNRLGFLPFYSNKEKQLAEKSMESLGILPIQNTCYNQLSGGQQQRVLLARALCACSKLLLLDEPVSGLDPIATEEMYSVIRKLNKEHGMTIIMISHDMRAVSSDASHVLHILHSQLFYGSAEEYFSGHDRHYASC